MNLRDFRSNDLSVMAGIPESDRNKKSQVSLLGLDWDTEADRLSIQLKEYRGGNTKREILQFIAGHFDPLRFVAPALLQWTVFCQSLWNRKFDWDVEFDEEVKAQLKQLQNKWEPMRSILTRQAMSRKPSRTQFHVFADASQSSFAATVYASTKYTKRVETVEHFLLESRRLLGPCLYRGPGFSL